MDLASLLSQQLTITPQTKAIDAILPPQQQNRSYPDTQIIPQSQKKLILTTSRFMINEYKGEWMMWYRLEWPGPPMPINKREATQQQLENFYKEFISFRSRPGEEKYYILKHIDKQKMQYVFNAEKWIKDNFSSVKQKFSPPISLIYKTRALLPLNVYANSSQIDLGNFLAKKFKEILKPNKLQHSEFGFIQRFATNLFDFSFSFKDYSFRATLKFSVILASLAAYMLWKYKKEIPLPQLKILQKKASNMKDVKNLDRYLKRL